jgi:hypothetical protein
VSAEELLGRIGRAREQLDSALRKLRDARGSKADVRAIYDLIEVANLLEIETRALAREDLNGREKG